MSSYTYSLSWFKRWKFLLWYYELYTKYKLGEKVDMAEPNEYQGAVKYENEKGWWA